MKTIKIKAARTSKIVAKVAGLLFYTGLFGLTLAPPSVAKDKNIVIRPGGSEIHICATVVCDQNGKPVTSPPPPPPPLPDCPPDATNCPEPLTILGSAMGAGGLIWLKKRRSEKDKLA